MKGQINLEFLFAAMLYISAVGGILIAGTETLPDISNGAQRSNLYSEAYTTSSKLLSKPGYSTYGSTTDWDQNDSTISSTTSIGLSTSAENHMVVEPGKLEKLEDFSPNADDLNYSEFKEISGVRNQYRFNFTWLPVPELDGSFKRYESGTIPVDEDDSLVGYWTFDEEAPDSNPDPEAIAEDRSGNGNTGTAYGNFGYREPGIRGTSAYYFDSAEYVNITSSYDSPNATVSMWIKPESLSGEQQFLNLAGGFRNLSMELEDGAVSLNAADFIGTEDIYSANLKREWTHISAVIDRDGSYSLYVNGELRGAGIDRRNLSTIDVSEVIVGAGDKDRSETDEEGFRGGIDDLRIYNRSLSRQEISEITEGKDPYRKEDYMKIIPPTTPSYSSSGNTVRYGRERIGESYPHFLAISHNGIYDEVYVSRTWDFSGSSVITEGDQFSLQDEEFYLKSIQNTGSTRGNALVLRQHLRSFGPEPSTDKSVITLERFAVYLEEPLKMEVLSW
ncbi:LamG domain-containing protein [Candidatus Nanohalococcus occultus]|uniref:LamG domain-containing protein n=1 Tax=Candidatus Nanohalococcus occultus TaxID=2978047 RepID=A0ABY8CIX9_9ARCH|nr:LamG domain-containing protein [Candidatus Nanohaloarchaeota archaeon SVXNc]